MNYYIKYTYLNTNYWNEIKTLKIKDLFELIKSNQGSFEIETKKGFKKISNFYLKENKKCYFLKLKNVSYVSI